MRPPNRHADASSTASQKPRRPPPEEALPPKLSPAPTPPAPLVAALPPPNPPPVKAGGEEPLPPKRKPMGSRPRLHVEDDDEETREIVITNISKRARRRPETEGGLDDEEGAMSPDDWPTQAVSHGLPLPEEPPEMRSGEALTSVFCAVTLGAVQSEEAAKGKPEAQRPSPQPGAEPPRESPSADAPTVSGITQAVRVGILRKPSGEAVVRMIEADGLHAGEHEALLIALRAESDLRTLLAK
jgi:hypothetical protein